MEVYLANSGYNSALLIPESIENLNILKNVLRALILFGGLGKVLKAGKNSLDSFGNKLEYNKVLTSLSTSLDKPLVASHKFNSPPN